MHMTDKLSFPYKIRNLGSKLTGTLVL